MDDFNGKFLLWTAFAPFLFAIHQILDKGCDWKKKGGILFLIIGSFAISAKTLGLDLMYVNGSNLTADDINSAPKSGLLLDAKGFLVKFGNNWYGIHCPENAVSTIPALIWPAILVMLFMTAHFFFVWPRQSASRDRQPAEKAPKGSNKKVS